MPTLHSLPDDLQHSAPVDFDNNLNIRYVGEGGNAGQGAYRFWYDDKSVLAPTGGRMTINVMDTETPAPNTRYLVYSYTTTSPRITAPKPPKSKTSTVIEFTLGLEPHELAFLSVVIWDSELEVLFGCDPQVGNDPETIN